MVDWDEISVLYTNADCLTNKKSEFLLLLKTLKKKPSIIAITEVKPKSAKYKLNASELSLEGYNIFHGGLEDSNLRGIVIYVDKYLKASPISVPIDFQENIFIEIKGVNKKDTLVMGNIYRSPNSSFENNCKIIEAIDYISNTYTCKKY